MKFRLVVVGKPRPGPLANAIAEYESRAARYWPLEILEIRDEPARGRPPRVVLEREGKRIISRLGAAAVIACDEGGDRLRSPAFAAWLQDLRERASDVEFVIGGALGLHDVVRERARKLLALAPWTMSHELARLVLAEQLYRAGTIIRGEPYHK